MSGTALIGRAEAAPVDSRARRGWRGRPAATAVGVLASAVSFVGSGIPSYWGDEAASVLSADRTLDSLFAELRNIDAVHGAYYLFLHFWVGLVGTSEVWVRMPSAIAIGVAAAGVVVLARQLARDDRVAIASGLAFSILPIVTRMGLEARSYAFAMAAAVWLAVALVRLIRTRETRLWPWALFGVGGAAGVYVFLYLALLVPVFLVAVLALRPSRRVVRGWLASVPVTLVLASPIMLTAVDQRGQVEFLARRDYASVESVVVTQWFGSVPFATLAWALILAAIVGAVATRESRPMVAVLTAWLAVPTVALLIMNAVIVPVYSPRYLSFCAPAVAILMVQGGRVLIGLVTRQASRRVLAAVVAAALILTAAPVYLAQRSPFAKDAGSDLRQAAEVVAANASEGDAIVFDESVRPSRKPRLALDLYPDMFAGLDDVALVTPARESDRIWARVAPLEQRAAELRAHDTVWLLEIAGGSSPDTETLESLGFERVDSIPINRTVLSEFSRVTS